MQIFVEMLYEPGGEVEKGGREGESRGSQSASSALPYQHFVEGTHLIYVAVVAGGEIAKAAKVLHPPTRILFHR